MFIVFGFLLLVALVTGAVIVGCPQAMASDDPRVVCGDNLEENGISFDVSRPSYRELRLFFFGTNEATDLLIVEEKDGSIWATDGEGGTTFNMRRPTKPLASELCVKEPLTGRVYCHKLDCVVKKAQ